MIANCKLHPHSSTAEKMFVLAATVGYAVKHNMNYVLPGDNDFSEMKLSNCAWNEYPEIVDYHEREEHLEIPFFQNIRLNGRFQNEIHFVHCKKRIQRLFFNPLKADGSECATIFLSNPERFTGDYVAFYKQAISKMKTIGCKFFIFVATKEKYADAFENELMPGTSDFYVFDNSKVVSELQKYSMFSNGVVTGNDLLGWWVAWLNPNPNKTVICPKDWSKTDRLSPSFKKDIIPESWIKL